MSVYVGGGTPTYVGADHLGEVLCVLRATFAVEVGHAEVTLEANPASADTAAFQVLRASGFNRASIGVQSLDDEVLSSLGRAHSASDARNAVSAARAAGFRNIAVDLMFGVPRQTLASWRRDLATVAGLGVEHISTYSLTVEDGTLFGEMARAGELDTPDEGTVCSMFEAAMDDLTAAGYEHYEVSNFARPGRRCAHNMVYWRNDEYLGFGAAAASYVDGVRSVAVRDPAEYVDALGRGRSVTASSERLGPAESLGETLMLGLRLGDGLDLADLAARYGLPPVSALEPAFRRIEARGLLTRDGPHVRLTRRGLMLGDSVAAEVMAAAEVSLRADSNR